RHGRRQAVRTQQGSLRRPGEKVEVTAMKKEDEKENTNNTNNDADWTTSKYVVTMRRSSANLPSGGGKYGGQLRPVKLADRYGRAVPENPNYDTPMIRFRASVDHEILHAALGENDKYSEFLLALTGPEHKKKTFMQLARIYKITLHELQVIYTDY